MTVNLSFSLFLNELFLQMSKVAKKGYESFLVIFITYRTVWFLSFTYTYGGKLELIIGEKIIQSVLSAHLYL